jgi:ribose 5-phosphate isomerase RpiB
MDRKEGGEALMRIAIGSDHAGYELKEIVRALVRELGHEVKTLRR